MKTRVKHIGNPKKWIGVFLEDDLLGAASSLFSELESAVSNMQDALGTPYPGDLTPKVKIKSAPTTEVKAVYVDLLSVMQRSVSFYLECCEVLDLRRKPEVEHPEILKLKEFKGSDLYQHFSNTVQPPKDPS